MVASPTYKASCTGLLKLFLERFPGRWQGVTAVLLMLGGHWKHALAANLLLKPILVELGAICPSAGSRFLHYAKFSRNRSVSSEHTRTIWITDYATLGPSAAGLVSVGRQPCTAAGARALDL